MPRESHQHVHCVGIAGIGLSGLAQLLRADGWSVSGSDTVEPALRAELERAGITVTVGPFDAKHLPAETSLVVRSAAWDESNPEVAAAKQRALPVQTYAEAFGHWLEGKTAIAVAGTHGKSTTAAMLAHMLTEAGRNPTALVGAIVPAWGTNVRHGDPSLVVFEADEFQRHFLNYSPTHAIVTNVDHDHVDTYPTLGDVQAAFATFVSSLPRTGTLALNAEDPPSQPLATATQATVVTFGLHRGETTYEGLKLSLPLPGDVNRANATSAAALALRLGISPEVVRRALSSFGGIWRRQEVIGSWAGRTLVSDYAHHPAELTATLNAIRERFPDRRLVTVFQPHHGARTQHFKEEFCRILAPLDPLLLCETFGAKGREGTAVESAVTLLDQQTASHRFVASFEELRVALEEVTRPGDLILFLGAGSVDQFARSLASHA